MGLHFSTEFLAKLSVFQGTGPTTANYNNRVTSVLYRPIVPRIEETTEHLNCN